MVMMSSQLIQCLKERVKNAELYVFTRIDYHKEWIIRDIDNRL